MNGRQAERLENYTKFWQKDLSKEGAAHNENRLDSYADVVNGKYPALTKTRTGDSHASYRVL